MSKLAGNKRLTGNKNIDIAILMQLNDNELGRVCQSQ